MTTPDAYTSRDDIAHEMRSSDFARRVLVLLGSPSSQSHTQLYIDVKVGELKKWESIGLAKEELGRRAVKRLKEPRYYGYEASSTQVHEYFDPDDADPIKDI